jgi:hypothetical protein
MRIDIDRLTEAELTDLNHRVVERLRFLNQMRAHAEMLEFRIGDRVTFQPEGRAPVVGMLTKYNRKSVTVITDDGQKWMEWDTQSKLPRQRFAMMQVKPGTRSSRDPTSSTDQPMA